MKARAEGEMDRRGLATRELKRGRGGIRDIEFAVQLLQLVHGRADPSLRSPNTLQALAVLASAGYVDGGDADRPRGGVPPAPHRRTPPATLGRGADPCRTDQRRGARADRPDVRLPGQRRARGRGAVPGRVAPAAGDGAVDPRTALLPPAPGGVQRGHGPPTGDVGRRRRAPRRVRVHRRAAHPRGARRADPRPHPHVAAHAADAAAAARAGCRSPPTPTPGCWACAPWRRSTIRPRGWCACSAMPPTGARRLCLLLGSSRLVTAGLERHPELLADLADPALPAPVTPASMQRARTAP